MLPTIERRAFISDVDVTNLRLLHFLPGNCSICRVPSQFPPFPFYSTPSFTLVSVRHPYALATTLGSQDSDVFDILFRVEYFLREVSSFENSFMYLIYHFWTRVRYVVQILLQCVLKNEELQDGYCLFRIISRSVTYYFSN